MTMDPAIAALIVACIALLFAGAALHKLRDLRRFDEIFTAYGLFPWAARCRLSRAVPLLEALVAGGLLLDAARLMAAGVGVLLLLAYAGAIAVNLLRGRRASGTELRPQRTLEHVGRGALIRIGRWVRCTFR